MKPGGAVIRLGTPRWKRVAGVVLRVVVYGGWLAFLWMALAWLCQDPPS